MVLLLKRTVSPVMMLVILIETTLFALNAMLSAPNISCVTALIMNFKTFFNKKNDFSWFYLLQFSYMIVSLNFHVLSRNHSIKESLPCQKQKVHTSQEKYIYVHCILLLLNCNLSRLLFIQVENYCLRNCYIMIQPYSTQQVEVYLSKMCNYPFKYIYLWLQMNLRVYLLICCRSQNWDVQYIERTVPLPCPVPLIESLAFSHAAQLELSILFSTVL